MVNFAFCDALVQALAEQTKQHVTMLGSEEITKERKWKEEKIKKNIYFLFICLDEEKMRRKKMNIVDKIIYMFLL